MWCDWSTSYNRRQTETAQQLASCGDPTRPRIPNNQRDPDRERFCGPFDGTVPEGYSIYMAFARTRSMTTERLPKWYLECNFGTPPTPPPSPSPPSSPPSPPECYTFGGSSTCLYADCLTAGTAFSFENGELQ